MTSQTMMTTTSQTTTQSTNIHNLPQRRNLLAIELNTELNDDGSKPGTRRLSTVECGLWSEDGGHNRLVSISHIRVIIVKWDNDLVPRWHLFIFLNFAVLIFLETRIKHITLTAEIKRNTHTHTQKHTLRHVCTLSFDCGTVRARSGNDHQAGHENQQHQFGFIGSAMKCAFDLYRYCHLTICIMQAIDQYDQLINIICYA